MRKHIVSQYISESISILTCIESISKESNILMNEYQTYIILSYYNKLRNTKWIMRLRN